MSIFYMKIRIDKSYLSRILKKFEKEGLIGRRPSASDGRAVILTLPPKGDSVIGDINTASSKLVDAQIKSLDKATCQKLIGHIDAIKDL